MSLSTLLSAAVKNPDGTYNIPKSVDHANKMLGTVLTIAEPIDGVWQLALTIDGEPHALDAFWPRVILGDEVTVDNDSDAAAAGEHAMNLLSHHFGLALDSIVYPDGNTVVC